MPYHRLKLLSTVSLIVILFCKDALCVLILYFKNIFQKCYQSVKQSGSRLIWVQTVCKGYEQIDDTGRQRDKRRHHLKIIIMSNFSFISVHGFKYESATIDFISSYNYPGFGQATVKIKYISTVTSEDYGYRVPNS